MNRFLTRTKPSSDVEDAMTLKDIHRGIWIVPTTISSESSTMVFPTTAKMDRPGVCAVKMRSSSVSF